MVQTLRLYYDDLICSRAKAVEILLSIASARCCLSIYNCQVR